MTGTTLQNRTFDDIWTVIQTQRKHGLVYGVTAAGVCALTGIERICPYGPGELAGEKQSMVL